MALNLTKSYTFSPATTIASSEVNTNYDTLYNAFTGLEAKTSTLAALKMDADPTTALEVATKQYVDAYASYRRPNLVYVTATVADIAANTGTANQTKIIFPDGNYRSVTEDTASATKYRRFDITAAAEFTSGTEDSGLRSGITEAVNTWYAIYAVKSTINTANFVLAGDTTLPLTANFSTLNSRYGTNGWVYLGLIRNGDTSGATGDILSFVQNGNMTSFTNSTTGAGGNSLGILLADSAGTATLAYTYAAGTGANSIPNHVGIVSYTLQGGAAPGAVCTVEDQSTTSRTFARMTAVTGLTSHSFCVGNAEATQGLQLRTTNSTAKSIFLTSFVDGVLGSGSNPLV